MLPYIYGLAAIGLVMSLVLERPAERIDAAAKGVEPSSVPASQKSDK